MSHRPLQVAATLQRAVQTVLTRGLSDPRVRGLITVTRVEVADDLRDATVYISVRPEEQEALTMHGLKSAAVHIRRHAGELIEMRSLPRLHFKTDRAVKAQASVIAAINKAVGALDGPAPDDNPPTPAQPDDENARDDDTPRNQSEESA